MEVELGEGVTLEDCGPDGFILRTFDDRVEFNEETGRQLWARLNRVYGPKKAPLPSPNSDYLLLTPELCAELRAQRVTTGGELSCLESSLWETAAQAPFGGIVIGRAGEPYLMRVYLLPKSKADGPDMTLYLHYFIRGDSDPNPHNHPRKSAQSLILTGGYTEFEYTPQLSLTPRVHVREPGSWNRGLTHSRYHRVELLEPKKGCWTLFIAGRRLHPSDGTDWGFWDLKANCHIPWGAYDPD